MVTIGNQRTTIDASQTVRLGRSPQCEFAIADPSVSQVHAYLVPDPTGWYIEDRGSTNGTFVDGVQVRRQLIAKATSVTLSAPHGGVVVRIEPVPAPQFGESPLPVPDPKPAVVGPKSAAIRLVLGRAPDCEIALPDRLMSNHHAELHVLPDGLHLADLRSRNGTFVNGRRVTETMLTDGDIVTLGNTDLIVANGVLNLARRPLRPHPEQYPATPAGKQTSTVWSPVPAPPAPAEPIRNTPLQQHDPLPETVILGVADVRRGSLVLDEVGYTLPNGTRLLDGVSFRSEPGSLTAIIGPSGAGKSTLVKVISGDLAPDVGRVDLAGLDLHTSLEALSSRLGIVPQDDILHKHLTVLEVLRYAARLRLSADTKEGERTRIIASVMADLGLTEHAETRVELISGGQRKRLSIAIELLTEPSALVLDEPTSGLDPALDRQVMHLLRQLADRGRIVVVVTHSLAYLSVCDDVLLLAPGGRPAYHGPVDEISDAFGTSDWADIFSAVSDAAVPQERTPKPGRRQPGAGGGHRPGIIRHHLATVMHRQVRLLLADTRYLAFLLAVPVFSGLLALVVPGNQGFGPADPAAPTEAGQLLTVMILAATFMGSALTVRDLVGERDIFLRERRAGLSPTAYLLGKTIVFGAFTVLQSAILVTLVCLVRGAPTVSTWAPWPAFELFLGIAVTAFASAQLALCGSAWVRSTDQVMPLLVVLVMTQLVVAGGLVPVTGRAGLSEFSMLLPSRWGYAITSSTIDLRTVVPIAKADALWRHTSGQWLFDAGILVLITTVAILVTARLLAARPVDRRRRSAAPTGARNTGSKGQRLVPSTANSSTAAISSAVNGAA